MKKIELLGLDLTVYSETLSNGLSIYVVPLLNTNNKYVTFSTKYGSIYNEFYVNDKLVKVPEGIAHFLEHKLFEQEDGIDPFTFFSERGADANASTTNLKTTYLFSGTEELNENINYLLDYVQAPYFTDTNVSKEKGIIEQEIKMYQDDPYTILREKSLFNTFNNHPYKNPIIGTIKSINSITKDDLYTCYNTFYHPSNMFVVVTGNVDAKEIIDVIKENQAKKEFSEKKEIKLKEYKESFKVATPYEEVSLSNILMPKVSINYKINISRVNMEKELVLCYLKMFFDMKVGNTSLLLQKLKDNSLIIDDIYVSTEIVDDYIVIILNFEAKEYKKVVELILEELNNLELDENDLKRKIKVLISSNIYHSDNIHSVNSKIMNNIIYYGRVIDDIVPKIRKMNIKDMNYILSKISLNNNCVCVIKSK